MRKVLCMLLCMGIMLLCPGKCGENKRQEQPHVFGVEVVSVGEANASAPRIYIYHTHTCEAYDPSGGAYRETEKWRTRDIAHNVVRVGEELAGLLRKAGFEVYHDTTEYEMPDLSTAYARSLDRLEETLLAPYDLYLDLHRDSYSVGNGKNTVEKDGKTYARLLFLVGKGSGQTGVDEKPDWKRNEKIASLLTDGMNELVPDICREVSLKSGRYNQHISPPCLLVEVGNNRNTLAEALCAMTPLSLSVCRYFDALH